MNLKGFQFSSMREERTEIERLMQLSVGGLVCYAAKLANVMLTAQSSRAGQADKRKVGRRGGRRLDGKSQLTWPLFLSVSFSVEAFRPPFGHVSGMLRNGSHKADTRLPPSLGRFKCSCQSGQPRLSRRHIEGVKVSRTAAAQFSRSRFALLPARFKVSYNARSATFRAERNEGSNVIRLGEQVVVVTGVGVRLSNTQCRLF